MIFVTVGAQMPFDRLVKAVDDWARARRRGDVFAQIGPTDWAPSYISWAQFIEPDEYEWHCKKAERIVAHAGTGSILTAMQLGKPILVMPRKASLYETRNDHQFATIDRFRAMRGVEVADDEHELGRKLDEMTQLQYEPQIGTFASDELLKNLRRFLEGQEVGT